MATIPAHYRSALPYLIVPDPNAAIAFYEQGFGAMVALRLTGSNGAVMHAELTVGEARFMLAGESAQMGMHGAGHYGGSPVTVAIYVDDVDARMARAVAAGATVIRPAEDQFYGARTGQLTDPFGLRWSFLTHIEDVSEAEMQRRMNALYG